MGDVSTSERLLDGALNTIKKMTDYIQTGKQEVTEVAVELAESKVENSGIKDLQDCIVELLKAEQRVNAFTSSVNQLKNRWKNDESDDSTDVGEVLQRQIQLEEEKFVDEKHIWEHESMHSFVDQLKEFDCDISKGASSNTAPVDGEMVMTQAQTSYKCPITQSDMSDPVKDKVCGHTFEKDAIMAHIKQCTKRRKAAKCPYPGCTNTIVAENLQVNTTVKSALKRRRAASQKT